MIPEGLTEPEILAGIQCQPDTQLLLAAPHRTRLGSYTVGWHDTTAQPYRGSFAVVSNAMPEMADLVGDTLRVTAGHQSVLVYVLGRATVPHAISLARRPFLSLTGLWHDDVKAIVERVE